jgi:hypothetical protein
MLSLAGYKGRRISTRVGAIVCVALYSAPTFADQVIPDDLIVQGSTCVGTDCVDGEAFGFNTLILSDLIRSY